MSIALYSSYIKAIYTRDVDDKLHDQVEGLERTREFRSRGTLSDDIVGCDRKWNDECADCGRTRCLR
jgi:hypothetical protein